MKVSTAQQVALDALADGEWHCSYRLGVSLSTLRALRRKGLVEMRNDGRVGAMWSPTTVLEWRLK